MMRTGILAIGAALALTCGTAGAATVSCPGTGVTTDREFQLKNDPSLTIAATCVTSGVGNIEQGNTPPYNDHVLNFLNDANVVLLDKEVGGGVFEGLLSITGLNATNGTWGLNLAVLPANVVLGPLYLALKSGEGNGDPDWAVFALNGETAGTWKIVSPGPGSQALSHANLYGSYTVEQVPLPAAGLLLLGGLGGLAMVRRRRKAA